jgi:hypothetical protein
MTRAAEQDESSEQPKEWSKDEIVAPPREIGDCQRD